ncbi:MAG: HAMP domain-containing histidine kinase [Ignavibacteriaceae bacterium]|nr:HAMP domain-containing histidine kinase [Ignavibacteriaceae bacterium]
MKLINKISRYYLLNSTIVFFTAFAAIYFALNWIIKDDVDEQLFVNKQEIMKKISKGIPVDNPPFIEVTELNKKMSFEQAPGDTSIYQAEVNEMEPFRQIVSFYSSNNKHYKLTVRTSLIEMEDLLISLLIIFTVVFIMFVAILYFINRKTTKEIFRPFYKNLFKLKKYSIKSGETIELDSSDIDEFTELNVVLNELSEKASKEYQALKEFTEDLSHELQTPVSIIKSRLELLLQRKLVDEEMVEDLRKAYQNINKLDKLNRSLILLAKLESKDFFDSTKINIGETVKKIIDNFADIAESKNIAITSNIYSVNNIVCNVTLADVLVSNLLSNAIRHNYENGKIEVYLSESLLRISNTGCEQPLNEEKLFSRFDKNITSKESIGLGLAIVKKICLLYNYKIRYSFEKQMHIIEVEF